MVPRLAIYTGWVYTPVPVYMASRGTTPTFRTHSLLKKFWVWSNVGHAAQQRGRPVRGIPPTGVYPEPAVHAVEQHAQHCSTPKTFLEENVSGRLAWCLDWPYTPVGCIHRFRCIWPVEAPRQPSGHILFQKSLGVEQCWACCSTALDCWFGVHAMLNASVFHCAECRISNSTPIASLET